MSFIYNRLIRHPMLRHKLLRLITRPPNIIVRFLRGIKEELTARVDRPVREDIGGDVPDFQVCDLNGRIVADVDAEARAVGARWVDASRQPETVLFCD